MMVKKGMFFSGDAQVLTTLQVHVTSKVSVHKREDAAKYEVWQ